MPDENDIIQAGLNGIGGNCITQNGFLYDLLEPLGLMMYSSYPVVLRVPTQST